MHRLHIKEPTKFVNTLPPQGERAAITQKHAKEAVTKRARDEAHRMGDALAHAKKNETPSIK